MADVIASLQAKGRGSVTSPIPRRIKSAFGFLELKSIILLEISGKRDSLEGVLITESEKDHILRAEQSGFNTSEIVLSNMNFRTFKFIK